MELLNYYAIIIEGISGELLISTEILLEGKDIVNYVIENSPFIGKDRADKCTVRRIPSDEAKSMEQQSYNEWYKKYVKAKERGEAVGAIPPQVFFSI